MVPNHQANIGDVCVLTHKRPKKKEPRLQKKVARSMWFDENTEVVVQ